MLTPPIKNLNFSSFIDTNFEKLNPTSIVHILSRVKIYSSEDEVEEWSNKSMVPFLQNLMDVNSKSQELPLKEYSSSPSLQPDNHVLYGTTWVFDNSTDIHINRKRKNSLKIWLLNDLIKESNNLKGCMMLFWLDFFKMDISTFSNANKAYKYLEIIRSKSQSSQIEILIDLITENIFSSYFKKHKPERIPINKFTCTQILRNYIFGEDYEQIVSKEKFKKLFRLLNEWALILDTVSIKYSNVDGNETDETAAFQEFIHNKVVVREFMDNLRNLLHSLLKQPEASNFMAKKIAEFFISKNEEAVKPIIQHTADVISHSKTDVTSILFSLFSNPNFFNNNIVNSYPRSFIEVLIILLTKKYKSESEFQQSGIENLEVIIHTIEKYFLSGSDFFTLFSDRYCIKAVDIFSTKNPQLLAILNNRPDFSSPFSHDKSPYSLEANVDLLFK